MHSCESRVLVIDPTSFLEDWRKTNPLERLTMGELMKIFGEDPEMTRLKAEALMEEQDAAYFTGQLVYRVELHTVSGLGYQSEFDHWAIEADGCADADVEKVLRFLNSEPKPPLFLRQDETYLCRLVSLNQDGRKYVWSTRRLEYDAGWKMAEWS